MADAVKGQPAEKVTLYINPGEITENKASGVSPYLGKLTRSKGDFQPLDTIRGNTEHPVL